MQEFIEDAWDAARPYLKYGLMIMSALIPWLAGRMLPQLGQGSLAVVGLLILGPALYVVWTTRHFKPFSSYNKVQPVATGWYWLATLCVAAGLAYFSNHLKYDPGSFFKASADLGMTMAYLGPRTSLFYLFCLLFAVDNPTKAMAARSAFAT